MRLSSLMLIVFLLIGFTVSLMGGSLAEQKTAEYRYIQRAALLAEVETTAMGATLAMSLERSVMQVALAFAEPIPQAFRDIVDEQRDSADRGLREALEKVDALEFLPTRQDFVQQTQAFKLRVDSIRVEIDSLLQVPLSERNPQRLSELPTELKDQIIVAQNATELLRKRVGVSTQVAGELHPVFPYVLYLFQLGNA